MHRSFRPLLLLSVLAAALELPAAAAPVSFLREVHPILSKAGCNQGICHGNANGKGGLKLSLRGQDPEMDHRALTRDAGARRWNRADPGRSLLLLKPTGALPHLGGIRFASHSAFSRTLAAWIAAGAPEDLHTAPALTELVVAPREQVVYALGPGKQEVRPLRQQIRVTARYGDGSTRDVTALACYESSDDKVSAAPDGQVVAPEGGDAGILVRFGGRMQTIRLTFVPRRPTVPFRAFPVRNYVDRLALEKLQALRLPPSELCDDSTFLRRLYLDTLGFPPSPAEVREFLAECGTERAGGKPRPGSGPAAAFATRERWVDRVLARPEYADFWVVKWADLLRAEERTLDPLGMQAFYGWLRKGFLENRPLDQFARDLLTATGSTYDQPAAAYYRRSRTPDLLAENTAQLFMGVRLNCAKCHNHPTDRWKQTDYHAMAAYFARVVRETKYKPRRMRFDAEEIHGDEHIVVGTGGEWMNPTDGRPATPRMLDDPQTVPAVPGSDRRIALATWLTGRDNPYFARTMANRIWHHLLGRGLVDPVDDFRDSNPAGIPRLLDALAHELAASGFNQKRLMRTILTSSVYQLSSDPNPANQSDERYFSHAIPRRLGAEQLLEAIRSVAGSPADFAGYGPETRVTQVVPTWQPNQFLRLFGQPARETVCECERNTDTTLGQSFELIGGRTVDGILRSPENRLARLAKLEGDPAGAIQELYFAAYARPPQPDEQRAALAYLQRASQRRTALEDLAWALINTREFLLRH